MTQEQIAAIAEVPRTYISRVENSRVLPRPAMLHRFAEALDVGFLDLLPNNSANEGISREGSSAPEELFWTSFLPYFNQLREEQKTTVLAEVRGIVLQRRHQERDSARAMPGPSRPAPVHALSA